MAMTTRFWATAVTTAFTGLLLAACSAAPPDTSTDGTESIESTSQAMPKQCTDGDCPEPPPKPPPPLCGWNPLTSYPMRCVPPDSRAKLWGNNGDATVKSCVSQTATDALSRAQVWFMQHGCSAPVYWRGWNPEAGWQDNPQPGKFADQANAWVQLCQYSNDIDDYAWYGVNGGQILPGADHAPHTNWGFCDAKLPLPPPGYYWVIPWMDPTCPMGGCMMTDW